MRPPNRWFPPLLAAVLGLLFAAGNAAAQKAMVVCPPGDTAGCERVATVLAGARAAGGAPLFPGGVDRRFADLATAEPASLRAYSLVFVPSFANAPYDLFRRAEVRERLAPALTGRVAVWSGTPDRGALNGRSAGKLVLIERLARWAAAGGGTGLVVLQDFSQGRADDGASTRYDWIEGISGVQVAPSSEVRLYREVRKTGGAAAEIVGDLAYENMASFGLAAPADGRAVGAVGVRRAGDAATDDAVVLLAVSRSASVAATALSTVPNVVVDIQPNYISLNSPGSFTVTVFIYSSPGFDATQLDPNAIRFVIDGNLPGASVALSRTGAIQSSTGQFNPAVDSLADRKASFTLSALKAAGLDGPAHQLTIRDTAGTFQGTDPTPPQIVGQTPVATVKIVPGSATIAVGDSVDLDVVLRKSDSTLATGRVVRWSSLDPATASVDSLSGLVRGLSAGMARIVALSEGKADTAEITVTGGGGGNHAPVAVNDTVSTSQDSTLVVAAPGVLANDSDADGDPLTAVLVSSVMHGSLTLNADGSFTYTPSAGYSGQDQFTYKASDGTADSNVATVVITVSPAAPVNHAPVAVNDTVSTNQDTPLTVPAPGVLGNDSDADGDPLTAVLVSSVTHGSLTLNADGSFTYTPSAGYNGPDSFTYKASDGTADSNVATVVITVSPAAPVNRAPVAVNDSYSTGEDSTLVVAAPGVLGNDTDADGDPLTAVLVSGVSHGTLTLNPNGSFTYVPAANYNGTDSFTYRAKDAADSSNVATVTITVNSVTDAPVAVNDSYSTNEDTPLSVSAPGVLGNDTNPEGGALSAVLVSSTTHGSLTLNADGSFTYTPNANYSGSDQFTYKANNGTDSNVATVTITVNPVNDAPVAVADAYTTDEDVPLVVAAPGVLANDTDAEGSTLTAVKVSDPAHGTLALAANGGFTYTPAANYFGPDQFSYKPNDGTADGNTVVVSITVNPVNDAPTAVADAFNAIGNVQSPVAATGVLANDTDIEGDALTVVPATVTSANGGTVVIQADGSFTFLSAAGFNGTDTFSYTLSDGNLTSTGTVTITVTGRYWFVDAAAAPGGDGRQTSKFQSLTPLNGAGGAGDPDQAGDFILVHAGTYSSAIALEANQQLLGQGIPASLTATVNGQTVTLLAAGSAPTIGSASGTTVQLAAGNTVRGAAITSNAGAGIAGSTVGALTINAASVAATGGPALDLNGGTSLAAAFSTLSSTNSSTQGLRLNGITAGSLTVSGATTVTNPTGTGIDIQNSPVTGTFAGTTVGKTASGTGVNLATNTGATFGFSSLGITTSAGTGLAASGTGTLNVATGSISATGGPAAQVTSTAGGITFTSLASTNSGGVGLGLSSVTGSFTSGTTNVQNPSGIGVQVASSGATVSLGATTSNGSGGTGVSLTGNTGGITFGALNVTPDAGQRAVLATDNSGTITTASGAISTGTTGIPVEITRSSGTTPLAVTLTSVTANGPLNGIKLSNTSGSFTVTGSGSTASSGGTLQNTTGDAVSLSGASNVTLRLMRLLPDASGIVATNLSGTNVVDRSVVDYENTAPAGAFGLRLANTSTNATLTLDGTTFQNKRDGTTAVSVSAMGSSVITFNVQDGNTGDAFESKFTNLFGSGVVVGAGDNAGSTAFVTANVSNSKFLSAPSNGLNNLEMTAQQNATLVPNITNNQFDKVGLPLAVVGVINFNTLHSGRIGSNAAAGNISGNSITNISSGAGPTFAYDPAGSNGYVGLRMGIENNVPGINHRVQILNNTFTGIARNGMYISARGAANDVNIRIDGNTVGTLAAPVGRANDRGIEIETQSSAVMKIDVTNNPSIVNSGTSGSNSALHFRSGVDNNTTGNIQATVTGNTIKNTNTGNTAGRFRAQTLGTASGLTSPAGSMCLDLRSNALEDGSKTFELIHESAGTFNRNATGNTGTVTTTGAIGTVASCTRPTL